MTTLHGDHVSLHGDRVSLRGDRVSLHGDRVSLRGDHCMQFRVLLQTACHTGACPLEFEVGRIWKRCWFPMMAFVERFHEHCTLYAEKVLHGWWRVKIPFPIPVRATP